MAASGSMRLLVAEKLDGLAERLGRLAGGKTHLGANIVGPAADGAHKFGAAGLDATPKSHRFLFSVECADSCRCTTCNEI